MGEVLKIERYTSLLKVEAHMRGNVEERSPEEFLTGSALGIGCFCVSISATLATNYMAAFLVVLFSLPFVTAPGSPALRNAGAGAMLGVAALMLNGWVATSVLR